MKTAMVLGATGLVGRTLVNILLQDRRYSEVTCLVRKPLQSSQFSDPYNRLKPVVIDFDNLQDYQGYFGVDHVYCCLGTTLKQAGSKSAFRRVDFEYVHIAAQLTRAQRTGSFVWISSVGADAKSSNFYLRVKGELENAIMRSESRTLEDVAQKTAPVWKMLMQGPLKKYRPVHAVDVARNMMTRQKW